MLKRGGGLSSCGSSGLKKGMNSSSSRTPMIAGKRCALKVSRKEYYELEGIFLNCEEGPSDEETALKYEL